MEKVARDSKEAYRKFYSHGLKEKNELLKQIQKGLAESQDLLLQANQRDIEASGLESSNYEQVKTKLLLISLMIVECPEYARTE